MIQGLACWENQIIEDFDPDRISDIIVNPSNVVWIDVPNPTEKDMEILKEEFGFHHLTLEDALRQNQRTKLDEYTGYNFIVMHILNYDKEKNEINTGELHIFLGSNYIVTVHKDSIATILAARERWKQQLEMVKEGVGFLVYTLMDTIIDEYFPILDVLDDKIDEIEDNLLEGEDRHENKRHSIKEIFPLRKNLLMMRRQIAPVRDILNILVRRDKPLFSHQTLLYFQDIYDHLLRILDSIDLYREMVTNLVETHLASQSNKLNKVMQTLTAMSIILMSISFIGAVYGMNFKFIPELNWEYGYWYALGLMGTTGGILGLSFWRKGWL